MTAPVGSLLAVCVAASLGLTALFPVATLAQASLAVQLQPQSSPTSERQSADDYSQRLRQLLERADVPNTIAAVQDYRIGPEDLIEISVYGAPDLSGVARVAAEGSISVPLVGIVQAAGLTPNELESVLGKLLRQTYMKDPHVSVFVKEVESHSVSVFGAVEKPGVFQIRSTKSLIEVLSMAQGLAADAGDTVIIMRHTRTTPPAIPEDPIPPPDAASNPAGGGAEGRTSLVNPDAVSGNKSIDINLRDLLSTGDPRYNALVYPGDVVTVTRAGVVYVVGEVNKPGGYVLKTNQNISVLQAIALAEGETHTASGKRARIIRTDEITGGRTEIPIDLNKIFASHAPDPLLHAKDIVFVPNNAGKAVLYHSTQGIIATLSSAAIYRW
jgi:polysaccharide export outer membrane protein